jgi:hypothetical protein
MRTAGTGNGATKHIIKRCVLCGRVHKEGKWYELSGKIKRAIADLNKNGIEWWEVICKDCVQDMENKK